GAEAAVDAAVGRPVPSFVFPNYGDHAYALVTLDPVSLDFARERLDVIEDPLLRQQVWQSLWHMVREQQLRSTDYLAFAGPKVARERDPELVETILGTMTSAIARYVPEERKAEEARRFFALAWETLNEVPKGDLQITWA